MVRQVIPDMMRRAVTAYSIRNRQRKAASILRFMQETDSSSVLLCGALGSGTLANESVVERAVGEAAEVVVAFDVLALGPQPWKFVVADGRAMPFRPDTFDLAVANAVVEHVGGIDEQLQFITEHSRVARNWVITTPNRHFPIEAHTATIGRHWSRAWRDRQESFTRLLSKREFRALLPKDAVITGRWFSPTFTAFYSSTTTSRSLRN
jgi:hypothetical protein